MDANLNEQIIDVSTGEVSVSGKEVVLRALALGSCVAVVAYDRANKVGGLAHVMLPGKSSSNKTKNNPKYAEDALEILLSGMQELGSTCAKMELSLFGGANMLGEGKLPKEIVDSILNYLEMMGIEPKNRITGGSTYRAVSLDVATGRIFYSEGLNNREVG
jgi:chemotaxis protein CheD